MTDERDVLKELAGIVTKYVQVNPAYIKDMNSRIKAIPKEDFPKVRQAMLDAREVLATAPYLEEGVEEIIRMATDLAGVRGLERGIYIGYVTSWASDPNNAPSLQQIVLECVALVDAKVPKIVEEAK